MLSNRPYLLRAFYQWIVDSNCNPILVIDANHPKAKVPVEYIENGEVVFNISPSAIRDLKMLNDLVEFKASFSGVIHFVSAPIKAILAVYAEENGEGIYFDAEEEANDGASDVVQLRGIDGSSGIDSLERQAESSEMPPIKAKPFLKLVE